MKTKNTSLKTERGQSLVELAISLTVIMILLSGTVEFGIALFQYVQLRDAAQEGALFGSLDPTNLGGITARIKSASSTPIDLWNDPNVSININHIEGGTTVEAEHCEGHGLQVETSYRHNISMPFLSEFIGSTTIPINVQATNVILLPQCP